MCIAQKKIKEWFIISNSVRWTPFFRMYQWLWNISVKEPPDVRSVSLHKFRWSPSVWGGLVCQDRIWGEWRWIAGVDSMSATTTPIPKPNSKRSNIVPIFPTALGAWSMHAPGTDPFFTGITSTIITPAWAYWPPLPSTMDATNPSKTTANRCFMPPMRPIPSALSKAHPSSCPYRRPYGLIPQKKTNQHPPKLH